MLPSLGLRLGSSSWACRSLSTFAFPGSASFVNGHWVPAVSGATFDVLDPATLDPIASVPDMDARDVEVAVAAAQDALPGWSGLLAKERAALLQEWYALIMAHSEDLAQLCTAECGKPIAESRGEVAYGASFLQWFAEEAKRAYGDVIPHPMHGRRILVSKQPVGVCALLTPWNFPVAMMTRKAGPALAAGCTTVMKPAEDTPLSTLALCELAERAGIPAGVLNTVTCSRDNVVSVGSALCSSPTVRKLSFTGSTPVGVTLMEQCASTVKRVSMELGGNAPFIVFEDADVDAAVEGAMASKYRNSGQTCVCANRFFVHDAVYDEFVTKFKAQVAELTIGHGADGVQLGPLINAQGIAKSQRLVEDAVAKGAKLEVGGSVLPAEGTRRGHFFQATVVSGVTPDMDVAHEEIFGPVAAVQRFNDEADVIARANASDGGLAGYFYSRDVGRVFRVAEALEVGMVAVNEGILSTEVAPFGGIKHSGIGREGARQGLDEYLESKYMCLGGL